MLESLNDKLRKYAISEVPKEACGLIYSKYGDLEFYPCTNISEDPNHTFIISPEDYATVEDMGTIEYVFHSHPTGPKNFSTSDHMYCNEGDLPWVLYSVQDDTFVSMLPQEYNVEYEGQPFIHGINDCFSLVRNYYQNELGIRLSDVPRTNGWWLKGENIIEDFHKEIGFVAVDNLKPNDMICMQLNNGKVMNHVAVYVGNDQILHHPGKRLSEKVMYNRYYRNRTKLIVRHKDLC